MTDEERERITIPLPLTVSGLGVTLSQEGEASLWIESDNLERDLFVLAGGIMSAAHAKMRARAKELDSAAEKFSPENSPTR